MRHDRIDVTEAVRGKWRGILGTFGLGDGFLRDKHGPCPLCGGSDRYRWDNKDGRGTYLCGQCGAGSGWDLLMAYKGWDFATAAREVRGVLGIVQAEAPKPEMTEEQRKALLRDLWTSSQPVQPGDVVDRYLTARGVGEAVYPKALRTCLRCRFDKGAYHPAMLAVVSDPDGKPVQLHRTYLGDGRKLDVPEPRKLTPGKVPPGSAIRLSDPSPVLGIAEGIETALAASHRFDVPVWAAISSGLLSQWEPPPGTEEVLVFGDSDDKFGGQKAAYALAHRLATQGNGLRVAVHLPEHLGKDWADYVGRRP